MRQTQRLRTNAFTLIELSIVIVVIGLLVSGVMVGRDLIDSANVRAQISQIEQYEAAANTFRVKYNCLPGDCKNAHQFGFKRRGASGGQGDGNGAIEANNGNTITNDICGYGEVSMFWVDLSEAKLIPETFTQGVPGGGPDPYPPTNIHGYWGYIYPTQTAGVPAVINDFYPKGRIPRSFVTLSGDGYWVNPWNIYAADKQNYFGISSMNYMGNCGASTSAVVTTQQAFDMDTKIDDGLPQSGKVVAKAPGSGFTWVGAYTPMPGEAVGGSGGLPTTAATAGTASTCYDNNSTSGATQIYSIRTNKSRVACSLRIKATF